VTDPEPRHRRTGGALTTAALRLIRGGLKALRELSQCIYSLILIKLASRNSPGGGIAHSIDRSVRSLRNALFSRAAEVP
jgi:hypothetical protein